MPPPRQNYCFTVRPSPRTYPEHEVEAIGSFTAVVPAVRTLGEFCEDMGEQFPFETPDTLMAADLSRVLADDTSVGAAGLAVGDELLASGYVDWVLRLDSISLADGPAAASAFDLDGFDADRMQEAAEDSHADPDADGGDEPVYRVQFQTTLAHEARGKSIDLTRDMRWRGRLPLGLLATAAVEESDGLLDPVNRTADDGLISFRGAGGHTARTGATWSRTPCDLSPVHDEPIRR